MRVPGALSLRPRRSGAAAEPREAAPGPAPWRPLPPPPAPARLWALLGISPVSLLCSLTFYYRPLFIKGRVLFFKFFFFF